MELSGWGHYSRSDCNLLSPLGKTPALQMIAETPLLLARGMGRSYGDAAPGGTLLGTRKPDRLRAFDEQSGGLRCDAGAPLAEIVDVFLPRGWFPRLVSVPGAIASDAHGKNHHLDGSFSAFVDSLTLACDDGQVRHCSHSEPPELVLATCGGMGLTGVIPEAALRLRGISSAHIKQVTFKAQNLRQALELFEEHHRNTYSVAWFDCIALGRLLLMIGEHARDQNRHVRTGLPLSIPADALSALLSHYSIQAFNSLLYHRVRRQRSQQRVDYRNFFFPLDGIGQWNRLYRRHSFVQYQFALPRKTGIEGLNGILKQIAASGRGCIPRRTQGLRATQRLAPVVPAERLNPGAGLQDAKRPAATTRRTGPLGPGTQRSSLPGQRRTHERGHLPPELFAREGIPGAVRALRRARQVRFPASPTSRTGIGQQ